MSKTIRLTIDGIEAAHALMKKYDKLCGMNCNATVQAEIPPAGFGEGQYAFLEFSPEELRNSIHRQKQEILDSLAIMGIEYS